MKSSHGPANPKQGQSLGRSLTGNSIHTVFAHRSLGERLYDAAFEGDVDRLKMLLEKAKPEDINWRNKHGASVLFAAAQQGHTNCIRTLAQQKCLDLDASRDEGASPLYIACQNGHKDVAQILIDKGVDKNRSTLSGATPLYIAAQCGHDPVVRLLMDRGVDRNKPNQEGYTPLFIASALCQTAVVKRLLENGADINKERNDGATPLFMAAFSGHSSVVEMLLKHGADRNKPTVEGCSPLFVAAQQGHVEVVRLLLEHGVDLSRANFNGCSPLQAAVQGGHSEIARMIKAREHLTSLNAQPEEANPPPGTVGRKVSIDPSTSSKMVPPSGSPGTTSSSTTPREGEKRNPLRSSGDPSGSSNVNMNNSGDGKTSGNGSAGNSRSGSRVVSSGQQLSHSPSGTTLNGEKGTTEVPRCKIIVGSQLEFDKTIRVIGTERDGTTLYVMDYLISRVAVRRLHKSYEEGYFGRKEFIREANILHELKHPKIVELLGMCQSPPALVFENVDRGDLFSLLARDSACHYSNFGRRMLADVAEGLAFLHNQESPHPHGALTSLVVLVGREYNAKISALRVSKLKQAPVMVHRNSISIEQNNSNLSLPKSSSSGNLGSSAPVRASPSGSPGAISTASSNGATAASVEAISPTNSNSNTGNSEPVAKAILTSPDMVWAAPEMLVSNPVESPQPTSHSDMYSFGVIVWEVLEQKAPWRGRSDYDRIAELVRKGKSADRLALSEGVRKFCPDSVHQAMRKCLSVDMAGRTSAAEFAAILRGLASPRNANDSNFSVTASSSASNLNSSGGSPRTAGSPRRMSASRDRDKKTLQRQASENALSKGVLERESSPRKEKEKNEKEGKSGLLREFSRILSRGPNSATSSPLRTSSDPKAGK